MSNTAIPILNLKRQYQSIKEKIDKAISKVLERQLFILGEEVRLFEQEVASYLGVKHAIGVASGSDALLLALMALDIKEGDEVITTPYTFFATASCIARVGAKPVFVDINPKTYNIDINKIKDAITPKTKAIIVVHLFGQMVELEKLDLPQNITIIEDVAQAFGARRITKNGNTTQKILKAGTIGKINCFSFFPTKNLSCYGDGGMLTTNDDKLAERLRRLRVHGASTTYYHEEIGINSRLDEIQAAVLRVKLPYIEEWNEKRRIVASRYKKLFAEYKLLDIISLPQEEENNYHVYHQYVIRTPKRDELLKFLRENEIAYCKVYYPLPLHLQKCFSYLGYKRNDFPNAEKLSEEALALPMFPELTYEEQEHIVKGIKSFFNR